MSLFSRTDRSFIGRWWWTVDRVNLAIFAVLIGLGLMLIMAASPPVALRHGLDSYHFVYRQAVFVIPALATMIGLSLLSIGQVRRTALILGAIFYLLLLATLVFGEVINGARRWLSFGGFAVQPSEFLKPAYVVLIAYVLSEQSGLEMRRRFLFAVGAWLALVLPLMLQPDFGQTLLVSGVCLVLMFLAGLPWALVALVCGIGVFGGFGVYLTVPHVAERVDAFLDPTSPDNYQVNMALKAIENGGLTGQGLGVGTIKNHVPDAHADFIFAVAGEEFGLVLCLVIIALFALIVTRGLLKVVRQSEHFVQLAAAGLIILIGAQAFINLGVNVRLLPAKGMTLPFISYGGSSLLALGITTGFLLALTRRRAGLPRHLPWAERSP